MLYFFRHRFVGSCLWVPAQVWKSSVPSGSTCLVSDSPSAGSCTSGLWDARVARSGAATFSTTVVRSLPCQNSLTTAKDLEWILLPRQAGIAEGVCKDWMLPAFYMSDNSNIRGPCVLHPTSVTNSALFPLLFHRLTQKFSADIFTYIINLWVKIIKK